MSPQKRRQEARQRKSAHLFLTGRQVILRSLEDDDMAHVTRWVNHPDVTHTMFTGQRPMSQAQVTAEWQRQIENPNHVIFLVEDRQTRRPVGLAGLYDIHPTARKAEFRILIGEKAFWNKGYGTEITELLTFYGFDRLNLNRVWLGVTAENKGGIRAYEKAGFRREGTLRQDLYRNSRYYDTVRMAVLREEYYRELYDRHVKRFRSRQGGIAKESP